MPIYDYRCPKCGKVETLWLKIAELETTFPRHCDSQMERLISLPMVAPDYPAYDCPITGREIRGRREHIENLKRTGCRLKEPGETEEYIRRKKSGYFQKELEREIGKIVDLAAQDVNFNT